MHALHYGCTYKDFFCEFTKEQNLMSVQNTSQSLLEDKTNVNKIEFIMKTLRKKEKLLIMSNFSFSHSAFYPPLSSNLKFQFGRV